MTNPATRIQDTAAAAAAALTATPANTTATLAAVSDLNYAIFCALTPLFEEEVTTRLLAEVPDVANFEARIDSWGFDLAVYATNEDRVSNDTLSAELCDLIEQATDMVGDHGYWELTF